MLCCGSGGIRSSARLLKAAQVKGAYLLDFPRTELSKRNLILHLYQAIILEKKRSFREIYIPPPKHWYDRNPFAKEGT